MARRTQRSGSIVANASHHPAASPPPRVCCPPLPPLPFRCPFDPCFASDRRRLARRPTPNNWPRQPEPSAGRGVALSRLPRPPQPFGVCGGDRRGDVQGGGEGGSATHPRRRWHPWRRPRPFHCHATCTTGYPLGEPCAKLRNGQPSLTHPPTLPQPLRIPRPPPGLHRARPSSAFPSRQMRSASRPHGRLPVTALL